MGYSANPNKRRRAPREITDAPIIDGPVPAIGVFGVGTPATSH